jgi:hypothetical protein
MSDPKANSLERKARSKVLAKKGFYIHFGIFAIMSVFLLTINLLTDPSSLWFYYPVVSWGVAVAIQYLVTFGVPGSDILSDEWEQRELEREMYIMQRKNQMSPDGRSLEDFDDEVDELELREPIKVGKNWDQDLV